MRLDDEESLTDSLSAGEGEGDESLDPVLATGGWKGVLASRRCEVIKDDDASSLGLSTDATAVAAADWGLAVTAWLSEEECASALVLAVELNTAGVS